MPLARISAGGLACFLVFFTCAARLAADSPSHAAQSAIHSADLFPYRFEQTDRGYKDVIQLNNNARVSGKALEWADQVLSFNVAGQVQAFPVQQVESIDFRRVERHLARPEGPDLTVAWVEGTPRADLQPGQPVKYRVHVLNAGNTASSPVPCRVEVDSDSLGSVADIPSLAPGAEHVFEATWKYDASPHTLRVRIDPENTAPDAIRWNNTFTQPTRAVPVAVVVSRDRYEALNATANMLDSYCFADFMQYHFRNLNALFAASVYPTSPAGVKERVVCDRIVVVDGEGQGPAVADQLVLRLEKPAADEKPAQSAMWVNWRWLKAIGSQLGLADLTRCDTTVDQCYVFDISERYAMLQYLSPQRATLMHTPGGFPLSPTQAAYLNATVGKTRTTGEYLYQLPKDISIKVLANDGRPLRDVQVDMFQLMSDGPDRGRITGIGRTDPLFSGMTDESGMVALMNTDVPAVTTANGFSLRPNPFGRIDPSGANGLLLLRLRSGERSEAFWFLPLDVCNEAFLNGHQDHYVHEIQTRFGPPDATIPPPPFAAVEMWERDKTPPPLILTWIVPKGVEPDAIEEFRVYKRTGLAGQETKPWTLISVHRPPEQRNFPHGIETYFDEFKFDGPHTLDTFFAVSSIDRNGRESALSEPGFVPYEKHGVRFAVDGKHAFMTARGPGASQMFFWDGRAGTQPHRMDTSVIPGYKPGFEGIAFMPDGRLVVTDPENHVLAFYDARNSELVDVYPRREAWPGQPSLREGEFNHPADVAVDDQGRLYVADKGNHRVQILDSGGRYIGLLDPDFRFRRPAAVGFSVGHISVTDKDGTRCRVYDISGSAPKFLLELPPLVDADRAMVNAKGKIYITGRQDKDSPWTVLSYDANGEGGATYSGTGVQGEMGSYEKPRSMYQHRGQPVYVYMMNEFPYDVRRLHIEQE